jgi:uncharacterized cupin superfamily protein
MCGMRRVNIASPQFSYDDDDPEGYRTGALRCRDALGAQATGTSVYELPPGQSITPYHYEHGRDEWLLVLEGRPTLRRPDGSRQLEPWDVAFFPTGPGGAHKVTNETAEAARVLMWSQSAFPAVSVYPDSGKIGVWTDTPADRFLVLRNEVGYWEGEL